MMIENVWSVICKDVIADSESNLISYINCLEELKVPKLPINIVGFSLGTLWERSTDKPEVLKMRFFLESPLKKKIRTFETDEIKMQKKRHRINAVIRGIPLDVEGTYNVIVEHFEDKKWIVDKKIPFFVKIGKLN